MCIGLPMQVISGGKGYAHCQGMGLQREVDTLLVGDQPVGTWLLIFMNSAREVLSEQDAALITDAVKAVDLVMQQGTDSGPDKTTQASIDDLFADLINREPPKPPSLIALEHSRHRARETDQHPPITPVSADIGG